jgi:hypothetical protein
MKLSLHRVSLLAWLCSALSACAGTQPTEALYLPPGIVQYYGDYNVVATFSTTPERAALTRHLSDAPLPPELRSPRLAKVRQRLGRINARILRQDPGIVTPAAKSTPSFVRPGNCPDCPLAPVPTPNTEAVFPHGFLRITAARCGPGEIVLKAVVQSIDRATQTRLIAAYEEAAPKSPTDEEIVGLLKIVKGESKTQVELHRWTLTDGIWMKHEADVVLLEGGSQFIGTC